MTNYNPLNPVWVDYIWIVMPIGQRVAANTASVQAAKFFESDDNSTTWDSAQELKNDNPGNGPATHLAIGGLVQQSRIDELPNFKSQFPGSDYWRESEGWTYDSVLADAGMSEIKSEVL